MTVVNYSLTVVDSKHHPHKMINIVARKDYSTVYILDNGARITVLDSDIQAKELIEIYGSEGTDYYITVKKEVA